MTDSVIGHAIDDRVRANASGLRVASWLGGRNILDGERRGPMNGDGKGDIAVGMNTGRRRWGGYEQSETAHDDDSTDELCNTHRYIKDPARESPLPWHIYGRQETGPSAI
jgi:hypothetical protein